MKNHLLMTVTGVAAMVATLVSGCGGGGGSSSSGSGGGSGGSSASLTGHIVITGGTLVNSTTAGATQDIQIQDAAGNTFTVKSVNSPESLLSGAGVVVLRAGSNLFSGTYASSTATYTSSENVSTPLALTSAGLLAHDTVIAPGAVITLPISSIGSLSFPNGIQVLVPAYFSTIQDDQDNTLTVTGSISLGSQSASGQYSFTGAGIPTGSMNIDLAGSLGLVELGNNSQLEQSPVTLTAVVSGTTTQFTTATVTYGYLD